MPETRATLRHSGTSASKVRQVLGLIRGLDVNDAREVLRFCERGAADEVAKLLDSAVANAEHNDSVPADELFISRAYADEGPTGKRWRPRARGRGTRIRKRTSHVTIVVARFDDDELERRRQKEAAAGPARGRQPRRRTRPSRRERVEATEAHDHDHDHDHDHEVVESAEPVVEDAAEQVSAAASTEATDDVEETEESVQSADAASDAERTT
jgi:large subunit ribosomal protein L22